MHAIRMPWVAAILAVALLAASTAAVVSTSAATVGPIHELAVDVDLHTDKPALQRRNAKKGKGITFKKHKPEKVKSNCHTSPASPTYDEIDHMTHKLSVAPRLALCTQLNGSGSGCTDHARRKGGQLGVCGDLLFAVRCRQLAWAGKKIKELCGNSTIGRAGGTWTFDGHLNAILH